MSVQHDINAQWEAFKERAKTAYPDATYIELPRDMMPNDWHGFIAICHFADGKRISYYESRPVCTCTHCPVHDNSELIESLTRQ